MVSNFYRKRKRDPNQDFVFKVIGIIFIIVVVLLLFADIKMYNRKRNLVKQIKNYEEKIIEIQESSKNLEEEIANSSNTDYLEKVAYEQLNKTRPGETQYIFVDQDNTEEVNEKEDNKMVLGWFGQLWQWIKGLF